MLTKYLKNYPKKHLIFDLDETLVTLKIDWSEFRPGFRKLANEIDPEVVKQVPEKPKMSNILYSKLIAKHGAKAKKPLLKYSADYEDSHYLGFIENKPLINFIREKHDDFALYIWSSNNAKTISLVVKQLGFKDFFKKIISKEDVNLLKPYLDGFNLIFDTKKHRLEDFLLIGDNFLDEKAAKNAKIDFLNMKHEVGK
ncbi:hypothetical protein A2160_03140 [Candidatus Beckwithbacteria bacterium RBG_13_42_9]|uniref:FCP1 homology domain-containing protein n=1 Tax=Candidatus Beckwithbacteria bacterium RBG_13_42_9 TaxID=1797457 RepID=A0A1F5E7Q6_9BACT|nr:MAG: hypothetical protein A2160_03140 [Candidatus Beckwithbacteria bacterium RBG_13_42_9]